jgi:hypothetical protein
MQLQKNYRRLLNLAYLDKNNPPPRWMTFLASFYLGMLLFLAAHMLHLI